MHLGLDAEEVDGAAKVEQVGVSVTDEQEQAIPEKALDLLRSRSFNNDLHFPHLMMCIMST